MKKNKFVFMIIVFTLFMSSFCYAEVATIPEVQSGNIDSRINYHIDKYEEYWDSIIAGEKPHDENQLLIMENEIVNSIFMFEDSDLVDMYLSKHNKAKEVKISEYEAILEKAAQRVNNIDNNISKEIKRFSIIALILFFLILIILPELDSFRDLYYEDQDKVYRGLFLFAFCAILMLLMNL